MTRKVENAQITTTRLGYERGAFTASIDVEGPGWGQSFGGLCLTGERVGFFIEHVLRAVGVERWEDLPGRPVRVHHDTSKIHALGHFMEDRWAVIDADGVSYEQGGRRGERGSES